MAAAAPSLREQGGEGGGGQFLLCASQKCGGGGSSSTFFVLLALSRHAPSLVNLMTMPPLLDVSTGGMRRPVTFAITVSPSAS